MRVCGEAALISAAAPPRGRDCRTFAYESQWVGTTEGCLGRQPRRKLVDLLARAPDRSVQGRASAPASRSTVVHAAHDQHPVACEAQQVSEGPAFVVRGTVQRGLETRGHGTGNRICCSACGEAANAGSGTARGQVQIVAALAMINRFSATPARGRGSPIEPITAPVSLVTVGTSSTVSEWLWVTSTKSARGTRSVISVSSGINTSSLSSSVLGLASRAPELRDERGRR